MVLAVEFLLVDGKVTFPLANHPGSFLFEVSDDDYKGKKVEKEMSALLKMRQKQN